MRTFDHNSGQYFEVNNACIYYEETGNREKPTLLMLHGGFENIENLNIIADYLSESFSIIGIDSRGHGKSTLGDGKLTYEQMQLDVEAILNHLRIDTLSILGFSDGGIVATRIAASNRVNVENLIIIGSSWSVKDVTSSEEVVKTINTESAKEIFSDNYKTYQLLNPEPDFNCFTQAMVKMWLDKTETGHPDERVKNISARTLIIRGDNDFLVSLESISALQRNIKDSSLLNVPFVEHVVHQEQKEIVEIAIKQFLCS
ncbi:MAG: alpha/beta hydrolase [Desulfobacterales bacterium]|nr:alpha/beta hydrolase [Desulfobacterales bacterium]MCP4162234.1 alpha/beta hydrolase [Deltaproteobacteria bacterium]